MANPAPCTTTLEKYGFAFVEERRLDPKTRAWGWTHPDGRACLITKNGHKATPWRLLTPGRPAPEDGPDEAALALTLSTAPVSATGHPTDADRLVSALRLLNEDWTLESLRAPEGGYTLCMRLLKRLRGTDRVAAKDATPVNCEKELAVALGVSPKLRNGARAAAIALAATEALKDAARRDKVLHKAEQKRIAELLRGRPAQPGSAPITIKRKTKRQRAVERAELQQELAAAAEEREGLPPLATPRADAVVDTVRAEDVRLLEDPSNGIVLLQVEKSNSQGAICVYNNGVRVAAGVVSPETLRILRPVAGADLLQAARELLTPIVESVVVTPVAQRHLTAVLNCKEIKPMATATVTPNKKFAPPREVKPAKTAKAVAEKPAKKASATKATHAAPASDGRARYAGKKIKVLNKEHGARPGTKRQIGMDIILKSKTTNDAIPALEKAGCDNSFIAFAVKSGLVELV